MKKILIIALLFWSFTAGAQDETVDDSRAMNKEMMAKIEAARIALITERLGLTPEQAEKFWPIYREFTEQRKAIRQELREIKVQADAGNISEEQSKALVRKAYALRQKELAMEKSYSDRMMQVITAHQLMSLKKAEDDFTREIIRRIQQRREDQMRRQEIRDRREEFQKEKRGN